MYLILIAWLYVVLMFAIAQPSVVVAVIYLLFLGVLPTLLLCLLMRQRERRKAEEALERQRREGAQRLE